MSHADWLERLFDPEWLEETAHELVSMIDPAVEAVAVRGMSGLIIGGLVSVLAKLPLIAVRKHENTHSTFEDVEFSDKLRYKKFNYCIVDDLISSGSTVRTIADVVKASVSNEAKLYKIYLYDTNTNHQQFINVRGRTVPVVGLED